jgi:hypothetical protein
MPQKHANKLITFNNLDTGEYRCAPQCTTHLPICPTEDIANLHELLNTKRALKRKHQEGDSSSEANLDEHANNHDINNNNSSNADDTSWIGTMIKAPPGECGHSTNADGCLGFKKGDMLVQAGITNKMWGEYIVKNSSIDSLQSTAH